MTSTLLAPDFKSTPFWWERTPRPALGAPELPRAVDVAIVGAGYTGLCAALQVARGGRDTLVLDAEDAGYGCSSRNGGQISTSIKPTFAELARQHGAEKAFSIIQEGHNTLAWITQFVAEERIDCDFTVPGRFHAAHNARQYERMARAIAAQPRGLEVAAHMVPRQEQHKELGTDAYFGGAVFEQHASLDPGRFHQGLLERVLHAGTAIVPHCAVTRIERSSSGFTLSTTRGTVKARDVVVATNGYTGELTPWLRRRVIPIGSYIIATETLPPALMERLMPTQRILSDSRRVVYYYRPSPDRTRILFGGRVTSGETSPQISAALLHRSLTHIFPELADIRISHSWMGFVAYTFDTLAHAGQHEGIYYAMGYCGSGVSMAGYLGTRIGQQVLGLAEGRTAFDNLPFPTHPLYGGRPWFLPAAVAWYRLLDRLPL
ncbi:MAG: FAD-dependent oxidoreductase [Gammaproteobacteria bacterium]|nr:FAD-dependent oxidoreductase [Gammaproteobacteria bacterium]